MKKYIISQYAYDAPPVLRDFLIYISTIRGKSDKTAYEYYLDLRFFLRYWKHAKGLVPADKPLDEISILDVNVEMLRSITLSDVYDYLGYIAQEKPTQPNSMHTGYGLSPVSRSRKISSLRAFFKYLTDKAALLEHNPVSNLDFPSRPKKLPRYLSLEDAIQLLEHVEGPFAERDYCILTLFLNCGMRVSELAGLNLSDIQGDTIRVLGKGNKERTIYLNAACLEAIRAYLPKRVTPHAADQNALFISRNRNRINVQTVKWLVKKHLTDAGLDSSKYSAHKLRHTAATLMYQNGVDIRTLQSILGHSNLDTTMIYTHIEDQNIRAAAAKNPLSKVTRPQQNTTEETNDD